jgi:hypothetical protein
MIERWYELGKSRESVLRQPRFELVALPLVAGIYAK